MSHSYSVTGTLTNGKTITLDEELPLASSKVRVVVERLSNDQTNYYDVMNEIRARQTARGYRPPSAEEVRARVEEERGAKPRR